MRGSSSSVAFACLLATSATASAAPLNVVSVGDLPGTKGRWQTGEVTVAAPPEVVQRWYSDAPLWPFRFPDVESAKVLSQAPDGTRVVEFKSRIVGRPLRLNIRESPGRIVYEGTGSGVTTQGRIFLLPAGPGQTRVILQTSSELHGVARVVVGQEERRERALRKLQSDLLATTRLANRWAATPRPRG